MKRKVCIIPTFPLGIGGGVAGHVAKLRKYLPGLGWEIVSCEDKDALIHMHAVDSYPVVDVFTSHGIHPIKSNMPDWQKNQNTAVFTNIKLARHVIAVSQWSADQWGPLCGASPHIIPNGVDLSDWVDIPKGLWRAKLGVGKDVPIVLWPKTHFSEVLDPTPALELAIRFPNALVVIPADKSLLVTAPKNVRLVGKQNFAAMQALMNDCDIYLATNMENHALQVLEAMALEKAILAYDWAGTGETLAKSNYKAGIAVTPNDLDGLAKGFYEALEKREVLGKAARALVEEHYQWDSIVAKTVAVYEEAWYEREEEKVTGPLSKPKCSVIIPCYNKGAYVADAIRSVLAQVDAPNFEVIVVDDGSSDESVKEIRRAIRWDGRARLIEQANAGVAAARNRGVRDAFGKYICCLDADDYLDPRFLSRLSSALDADPTLGIAYSDFIVFGERREPSYVSCSEYDFEKLKRGNILPCCNLFRKKAWEAAGGYKDINPSWEDYELWLNMGKLGWHARRIPAGLWWYRKLPKEGRDFESQGLEWKLRGLVNRYHRDLYPPLVSFVIPCYEQSRFLREAIDSVMEQTFPDFEVVVVDDGNEIKEAKAIDRIVESYGNNDVRAIHLAMNSGLATARNTGITAARGQWIVPLDADDKIAPEFLNDCFSAIQMDPRKFAYTDSYLWWPEEEGKENQLLKAADYDFNALLIRITWPCTILYSKEAWRAVGGYKPIMSKAGGWEDWELVISFGEVGICGEHVSEPHFYYRQHSKNQMRYEAQRSKASLQELVRRLHASVYRGERTMSCCGGGRRTPAPTTTVVAAASNEIPKYGNILVRYVGFSVGTQNWTGPSGRVFRFGQSEPLAQMSEEDAAWFDARQDFQIVPT